MTDGPLLTMTSRLAADEVEDVLALVGRAGARDGFPALNEAALLHLQHPRPEVQHLVGRLEGHPVGYAQLDETPTTDGPASVGQLVVDPAVRRRGVGAALLTELLSRSSAKLQIWAMANAPAAQALASRVGMTVARELLVMTRPLEEALPEVGVPPGVELRTFVVGQDEDEWLGVNARAFRDHPEQGQLTRSDLDERMAQPWFDAAGFFLAVRDQVLIGFHWTKQHPDALGEVYVLGVDPEAGGRGLGKALLSRGLAHLRQRGNMTVQLYVEADHARAVGLYQGYGFTVASRDVMYAQP